MAYDAHKTNNAFAMLSAWSATFEQHYKPGVADFLKRHGRTTRIIPTRKQRVLGNTIEYEVKAFHNRSTRVELDPMADQPDHIPGEYTRFTVSFDHTRGASGTNNDFGVFEVAFTTTIYDLWKRGDKTWKDSPDFIKKDVTEGLADVRETFAKYIHLDANGVLGTIDTTAASSGIKLADSDMWDSASAFSGTPVMVLVKLTASAIGRIGDGQRIDLYNQTDADYNARNARVAYVHPYDETLVLEIVVRSGSGAAGAPDDTYQDNGTTALADWDALNTDLEAGDTVVIAQHDSYGNTPSGTLAGLFDVTSSYFGTARDTVTVGQGMQRMLQPIRVDASAGGANVPLTADWYRRVGEVVGWQQGGFMEGANLAQVMTKYEYRQIADFIKEEGITMLPALESDVGKKLNKAFGFDGFVLHDPSLGTQMVIVDDFATPGQIDFINRNQWEQASPIDGGFRMFPGNIAGMWSRDNQTTAGVSHLPGKTYSANGLMLACWVCKWPKGQIRLQGLSTT